jgi:periplasmic protein TonB
VLKSCNSSLITHHFFLQLMDLSDPLHLITKHITMTNKEIAQANLLDIIFENRNKEYGAYALRQGYNNRMLLSLGAGLSVILLFVFMSNMNTTGNEVVPVKERPTMMIKEYIMPAVKPKLPGPPKEIVKTKPSAPAQPKIASVQFTSPPKIKEVVKNPMPPITDIPGKTIDDKKTTGIPDDGTSKLPVKPVIETGTGAGPSRQEPDFVTQEREPEFPGGSEGLKKFLSRYLNTPAALQSGEMKVVKVRFKVEKDGSVTSFEILASGGNEFDGEVVRVCRKMPKWVPALQNGMNVPVSYVLPVTFIGLEE